MNARPLFRAWTLSLRARLQRLTRNVHSHLVLVGVGCVGVVILVSAVVTAARSPAGLRTIAWLMENEILVSAGAALYALLCVLRRRANLSSEYSQSWLLATPLSNNAFRVVIAVRVCVDILVQALVVSVLLSGASIAAGHDVQALKPMLAWLNAGLMVGTALGAVWRVQTVQQAPVESRLLPEARTRTSAPSLAGLSRWPIAKAVAWHRPENARVLFIIAALSVPAGASALLGICILAVWSLSSYLLAIARAVPAVAKEASLWLRPTALPFGSFAWAIGRRALVHQIVGTALMSGVFILLDGAVADVIYLAGLWIALTMMVDIISLRQSYLGLPIAGRTFLSLLVVIAAETRARGSGLPLAAVLIVAHLRGAVRGRA